MEAPAISRATRLIASARRTFVCAALAGLPLLIGVASSDAQPAVRQVLLLQSFNRGNVTLDYFTNNFRVELDQRSGTPVNVVQIIVGPTGFIGAPERETVDYIRSIFADRPKPDLIMTAGGPAAVFAPHVSTAAVSRNAASFCRSSIIDFSMRHLARTRPPSRLSTIILR